MDADSFIVHVKPGDVFEDIAEDIEQRFHTSNYKVKSPLAIGKNRKLIAMMNDELGAKIKKKIVVLRPKMYRYLTDDGCVDKKANGTKKCVIKRERKIQDFKEGLKNNRTILKSQPRFRSEAHNVFMETINKIALIGNGDKRLQMLD